MLYIVLLASTLGTASLPAEAQRTVNWRSWTKVSCHPGLDFRIGHTGPRLTNGKYIAHVQFRNRYREAIYFSYVLREPGAATGLTYRTDDGIPAGSVGPETQYVGNYSPEFHVDIPPGAGGEVFVQFVRFGSDAGPYRGGTGPCTTSTASEPSAPPSPEPQLRNPIRAWTERTHDLQGSRIWMLNETEEPLIVTAIFLYDCENIRNPCDVAIPVEQRLDPGEEAQMVVVRSRNRDRRWTYRYRYTWNKPG